MALKATNAAAQAFKGLHIPGKPLLLANVHDVSSARMMAILPNCSALATASYSVALANGTEDAKLNLETQLMTVGPIAAIAREFNKPLTVDLQDGYGDRLEEAITEMIGLGVVGINLEDSTATSGMMAEEDATQRIKRALKAAAEAGVPDFVINARSDSFFKDGNLDEAIKRGQGYLKAGATTVYILGHAGREITRDELDKAVKGLDGRLNVALRLPSPGRPEPSLTTQDLVTAGVARVSIGPQLYFAIAETVKSVAAQVLGS